MTAAENFDSQVEGIAALSDPLRRSLYRYVITQPGPVGRDEAANAVGVPRHVAAFHLDRLVEDGLLETEFRRPEGRSGPGAGRPAKLYKRSAREFTVSLPDRRYAVAGRLMAEAITRAERDHIPLAEALRDSALEVGHAMGDEASQAAGRGATSETLEDAAEQVLEANGYEPRKDGREITLANCPFHALAQEYPDLVCRMNLDLIGGLVERLAPSQLEARLEPSPGRCCVVLHQKRPASTT